MELLILTEHHSHGQTIHNVKNSRLDFPLIKHCQPLEYFHFPIPVTRGYDI